MDDSGGLEIPIIHRYLKYYGGLVYDEEIIPRPEGSQMRTDWSSLPLLALKQVLKYLSRADALSCMSTCRHWRSAMLMYEDHKHILKLRVNDIERSLFVTRIYRRNTKRLIVMVNTCDIEQITRFINTVISLYYDVKLQELVFIGNSYLHQNALTSVPEIPKSTIDYLVVQIRTLKRLCLMGVKLNAVNDKRIDTKDKKSIRGTENIRLRIAKCDPLPCDSVLSRSTTDMMKYSVLNALVLDYDLVNTESLETLSELKMLRFLTMLIRNKPHFELHRINWLRLQTVYPHPLNVTVCLLQLPYDKIEEVMDNVFVQGLKLVSLKAIYCKTMHMEAIVQVANMYSKSLQELVWVDLPLDSKDVNNRSLKNVRIPDLNMCDVNPLVLMCWQCERLKRIVIHGYRLWQYDVVGMVRLRHGLRHLELSSVFAPRGRADSARYSEGISRVLRDDPPHQVTNEFLQQISCFDDMKGWRPVPHAMLHPGLRYGATRQQRADYILLETRTPFGVTYPYKNWGHRYYEQLVCSTMQR